MQKIPMPRSHNTNLTKFVLCSSPDSVGVRPAGYDGGPAVRGHQGARRHSHSLVQGQRHQAHVQVHIYISKELKEGASVVLASGG